MEKTIENIEKALKTLELPKLITREDIKKQYRFLAKKFHPDRGGSQDKMDEISRAYALLMKYIEEFRYTFDEQEFSKQLPGEGHDERYKR